MREVDGRLEEECNVRPRAGDAITTFRPFASWRSHTAATVSSTVSFALPFHLLPSTTALEAVVLSPDLENAIPPVGVVALRKRSAGCSPGKRDGILTVLMR